MASRLKINSDFISICNQIQKENLDLEVWCLIESSDQFQANNFCGGFDATEEEFCFSYYEKNEIEYWFQFPLADIERFVNGEIKEIELRKAE
ncbi:hypothetical protein ATE84_2990 [Aquimarina sp. MAR_2010_214]|uniref:hypothetical protein n=1 Tax=Aquimarina sp. MAR_2010_214 TaxID=1250026 RepID=UPI000C709213|nr:hypothetical protein [Aquimarina sp. MAR_2010_214]PKV50921.1 hypothetical protein ATE84_2990 [Aquimarina sp. MAR_2010_214]